ncbi:MAG: type VI secretion system baseplate subunit TssG [Verrucomicrobia bacterium]|nr:type VI secretion system baseplate subunit TssG [Verrucomicrobiota bacterium]
MVAQSVPQQLATEPALTQIQRRIKEKIRHFEAAPLLKLLHSLGYKSKDIHFVSNPSLSSAPSLFEDIAFSEDAYPKVTILVNLGLLTANSPLPSYFRKKMDSGAVDPELLTRFLSFFDHHLIMTALSMGLPEENGWFFSNWENTLRQYLSLLALNSTSTLCLLLQLCFPELKVEVYKFPRVLRVLSSSMILGVTALGKESYLGKSQKLTVSSFKIILTSESMDSGMEIPWPIEALQRLKELIFPLIHRANIYTQINLIVKNCQEEARLSANSYLGYRSLGANRGSLQLRLFAGYPKE